MGRRKPARRHRSLSLINYLTRQYAPPPVSRDWTPAASVSWKRMYANDQVGDCIVAGGAHWEGVITGNGRGTPKQFTDDRIIDEYSTLFGYVRGDEKTDNGGEISDALNYWEAHGLIGGTKIASWVRVNPKDRVEIKAAINEFGGLMAGMSLPDAWVKSEDGLRDGGVWDVAGAPDENNGHCVVFAGFNDKLATLTWGMNIWTTFEAIEAYCDELYAMVSQDWLDDARHLSPPGLDWTQLRADIQAYS